jgi:antirestriction protein
METDEITLDSVADDWAVAPEAIKSYCSNYGVSLDETDRDHFFDSYCGQWDSLEAFAEEMVDELVLHEANRWLADNGYIAYDRIARDMSYEGYWISPEGHVFRPA